MILQLPIDLEVAINGSLRSSEHHSALKVQLLYHRALTQLLVDDIAKR